MATDNKKGKTKRKTKSSRSHSIKRNDYFVLFTDKKLIYRKKRRKNKRFIKLI